MNKPIDKNRINPQEPVELNTNPTLIEEESNAAEKYTESEAIVGIDKHAGELDIEKQELLSKCDQSILEESKAVAISLLEAINDSAKTISALYITFILMLVYAGLVIAGTTDNMLLKNTDVHLPLL